MRSKLFRRFHAKVYLRDLFHQLSLPTLESLTWELMVQRIVRRVLKHITSDTVTRALKIYNIVGLVILYYG